MIKKSNDRDDATEGVLGFGRGGLSPICSLFLIDFFNTVFQRQARWGENAYTIGCGGLYVAQVAMILTYSHYSRQLIKTK